MNLTPPKKLKRNAKLHGLTPRETDVVLLLATGETQKTAAARLKISLSTLQQHVSRLLIRLNAESTLQAILFLSQ